MNAKILVLPLLLVVLFWSATAAIPGYAAPPRRAVASLGGVKRMSAGRTYTSPNHIFTIVVPHCNPAGFSCPGWDVLYESEKGTHVMVTFSMPVAVQTYRTGIVETGTTRVDLNAVAHAVAVSRKHQVGVPFDFVEETKVSTQLGEGSLRVYSMKGGSLDKSAPLSPKPQYQYHDSYIAVLLVPQEKRILFAVSQDDNFFRFAKTDDESWKKSLETEVQAFFATMTVAPTPD
jgi:hypothetical protein